MLILAAKNNFNVVGREADFETSILLVLIPVDVNVYIKLLPRK